MNDVVMIVSLVIMVMFICLSIYLAARTYNALDNETDMVDGEASFKRAMRNSLYPNQDYFRLWDLIRTPFMILGVILGIFVFFMVEAGQKLLPKLFGLKLFKFKKED